MKTLHHKIMGEGEPIIILHGLFGMLDNWKTFARSMPSEYQIILVDQRNHGRSFHDPLMNYEKMADDLRVLLDALHLDRATVVGHSMGGKTAMEFSRRYPKRVSQLVVVDIGPQAYPPGHGPIFKALKAVPVDEIESRSQAQEVLAQFIPETSIQLFLLKNLKRNKDGSYSWRMNLAAIENHYEDILAGIDIDHSLKTPTLFVSGTQSKYIRSKDEDLIRNKFDELEFQKLDTGHWVHAERPKELREGLLRFLRQHPGK